MPNSQALTLYGATFSADFTIDEKDHMAALKPDGEVIAYIGSNYGEFYHIDWEHCKKVAPPKKSTRGRKPNPPIPRTKERKGTGEKFDSSITFGVIIEGKALGVKVFRKDSCNIYSISGKDYPLANLLISRLFGFINDRLPGANMQLKNVIISLRNMNFLYPLPQTPAEPGMAWVVNIHRLRRLLSDTDVVEIFIDGKMRRALIVYPFESPLRLIFRHAEDARTYNANLSYSGKLYIYGGNRAKICKQIRDYFFGFIDAHRDHVVMQGIPMMKSSEKKALRIAAEKMKEAAINTPMQDLYPTELSVD